MASEIDAARATIEQRIAAEWSATPVAWAGLDFDPPEGAWLRPVIVWGDGARESHDGLGAVVGVVFFQLFDRPNTGFGALNAHADTLRDLFGGGTFGALTFDSAGGPVPREADEAGQRWNQVTVRVPFTLDETILL